VEVSLAAGSTLHLGFTYKYTAEGAEGLLRADGLEVCTRTMSEDGAFLLLLLRRR